MVWSCTYLSEEMVPMKMYILTSQGMNKSKWVNFFFWGGGGGITSTNEKFLILPIQMKFNQIKHATIYSQKHFK